MSGGKVFEKAGVNLSVVYGTMPQEALAAATARGAEYTKVCGCSLTVQPKGKDFYPPPKKKHV